MRLAPIIVLLVLAGSPGRAGPREKVLLLDRSPLAIDRGLRRQVMRGLQNALENGGFLVQRPERRGPSSGNAVDELLAEARSHSERFREQQALQTLDRAERLFRAGYGAEVSIAPLLRVLLARARLCADLGRAAAVDRALGRALAVDPNLTLDPGHFPPAVVRTFKRIKRRTGRVALTVNTAPAGRTVWVDGKLHGPAPALVKLLPGEHFLAVGQQGATRGQVVMVGPKGARVTLQALRRRRLSDHRLRNMGQEVGASWVIGLHLVQKGRRHAVRVRALPARTVEVPRVFRSEPVDPSRLTWATSQVAVQLQDGLRGTGGATATAAATTGPAPIQGPTRARREGSVLTSWWFWTAVVAVVGGGTAAAVVLTRDSDPGVRVTVER